MRNEIRRPTVTSPVAANSGVRAAVAIASPSVRARTASSCGDVPAETAAVARAAFPQGNVYLRSSSHQLPDLVVKLKGPASQPIEIDLVGKTDAVKAALRNTFEAVPDQPVSKFHLELFGGKRGLVEMSGGFCAHRKANVQLTGQNGKAYDTRPVVGAKCPKKKHRHGGHRRQGGGQR